MEEGAVKQKNNRGEGNMATQFYKVYNYDSDTVKEIITSEPHYITENPPHVIYLRYIPKKESPSSVIIEGYVEVTGSPQEGEYRVYYSDNKGKIEFNEADAGKQVFVSYKAIGSVIWGEDIDTDGIFGLNRLTDAINKLETGQTRIEGNLVPDNNSRDLGSTTNRWNTIYGSDVDVTGNISVSGTVDGRDVSTDGTVLDSHVNRTDNPHQVTKEQVGLGSVIDVEQASKAEFQAHVLDSSNPHGVTKVQVGLGNVDNVKQATKTEFDAHLADSNNPHGVTKSQIGLDNVDNVKQATKTEFDAHVSAFSAHGATSEATANRIVLRDENGQALMGSPTQPNHIARKADVDVVQSVLNSHVLDTSNPHEVTKEQVGLGNVDNIQQATKTEFDAHVADISNPHNVTKAQVGLGNVDNIKQATKAEFDAHVGDTNNPHGVTKAQIGLGNVENKSSATIRSEITSTNITNALGFTPENATQKGQPSGYASLDASGKIPLSQLPDMSKQQTYVVDGPTERNALSNLVQGDKAFETSTGDSYIWDGSSWLLMADADWENVNLDWANIINGPSSTVANIDDAVSKRHSHSNMSALNNISQAQIDNWNSHLSNTSNPHSVTKSQVGLGNVDNVKQATKTEFDSHTSATSVHGATYSAVADRIMMRDASGRSKVAAPSASDDIARKDTVDAAEAAAKAYTDSHPQLPSTGQKAALAGTSGTPSSTNRYVTNSDSRLTNARTPTAHAASHASGGSDPITPASIGAAPSSHNHSTSNITSGIFPVARGGTGIASYTPGNYIRASGATTLQQRTPAEVLADIGAETPSGAQAKVDAHANLTAPHSATSSATANRLVLRDANGRAQIATPSASGDIANKGYVDGIGTSAATANTVMRRDGSGRAKVAAPSASDDIARKDTVDAAVAPFSPLAPYITTLLNSRIIEHNLDVASPSNGYYVRFANGFQIAFHQMVRSQSGPSYWHTYEERLTWTLPATFDGFYVAYATAHNSDTNPAGDETLLAKDKCITRPVLHGGGFQSVINYIATVYYNNNIYVEMVAIGRWS